MVSVMECLDNYQKLARKVILEAIQDYYNYSNGRGSKLSKREGAKVRNWIGTSNFDFWCEVIEIDNIRLKTAFEKFLYKIDNGGSLPNRSKYKCN